MLALVERPHHDQGDGADRCAHQQTDTGLAGDDPADHPDDQRQREEGAAGARIPLDGFHRRVMTAARAKRQRAREKLVTIALSIAVGPFATQAA